MVLIKSIKVTDEQSTCKIFLDSSLNFLYFEWAFGAKAFRKQTPTWKERDTLCYLILACDWGRDLFV